MEEEEQQRAPIKAAQSDPPPKAKKKKFEDEEVDPFINTDTNDDGLNLPNVIILVSDNVKLIRMNALPMLQVQLEII